MVSKVQKDNISSMVYLTLSTEHLLTESFWDFSFQYRKFRHAAAGLQSLGPFRARDGLRVAEVRCARKELEQQEQIFRVDLVSHEYFT